MKTLFNLLPVVPLAIAVLFTSCEPPDQQVSSGKTSFNMGNGEVLNVRTITIEGNDYLAYETRTNYWGLCPKLPPKPELSGPARPEAPIKP